MIQEGVIRAAREWVEEDDCNRSVVIMFHDRLKPYGQEYNYWSMTHPAVEYRMLVNALDELSPDVEQLLVNETDAVVERNRWYSIPTL